MPRRPVRALRRDGEPRRAVGPSAGRRPGAPVPRPRPPTASARGTAASAPMAAPPGRLERGAAATAAASRAPPSEGAPPPRDRPAARCPPRLAVAARGVDRAIGRRIPPGAVGRGETHDRGAAPPDPCFRRAGRSAGAQRDDPAPPFPGHAPRRPASRLGPRVGSSAEPLGSRSGRPAANAPPLRARGPLAACAAPNAPPAGPWPVPRRPPRPARQRLPGRGTIDPPPRPGQVAAGAGPREPPSNIRAGARQGTPTRSPGIGAGPGSDATASPDRSARPGEWLGLPPRRAPAAGCRPSRRRDSPASAPPARCDPSRCDGEGLGRRPPRLRQRSPVRAGRGSPPLR